MFGEVFIGLMLFLSFLAANLLAGTALSSAGIDITTLANQALSAIGIQ